MNFSKGLFSTFAKGLLPFLVAMPAYADFTLQNNSWEMMTVPADASSNTIASLFGDDLPANRYGQSWNLFQFDAAKQEYIQPAITDSLAPGDGFWMIQTTGSSVIIDLPGNLPQGSSSNTLPCSTVNGCFSSKLPATTANGSRWSMLGAPFSASIDVSEIRLTTSEDHCNSGFNIGESVQAGYITGTQWAYDSDVEEYESLVDLVTLNPWQGFWIATPQQPAPIALFLLLPNPLGNT